MSPQSADAQRSRIVSRGKPLRDPAARICVVVGGRGICRELAERIAVEAGHAMIAASSPIETVDAIVASSFGRFPRVIVIAPAREARPIVAEIFRRAERSGLNWLEPVDLLEGLRSVDRITFLRHTMRTIRGAR